MNLDDLNKIDFKNVGSLPWPVKSVMLLIIAAVIIFGGYWFLWGPALEELDQAKQKETELRDVFISKKKQAINLAAYKQQMVDIERTFGALLKQLPNKSQMDGLLTDINQAGLEKGLEFDLFKPGKESIKEFYAELPISIRVIGDYHSMGAFAVSISKLSRIVTLNDIYITQKDSKLAMEAVAKTYRYLDAKETSAGKTSNRKFSQ